MQKSAAGRGVGGVQTSRIASEANREYIFSSSFSGDKELVIFNFLSVTYEWQVVVALLDVQLFFFLCNNLLFC